MKILVTGATGFVGNHLTKALVDQGHQVRALVLETDDASRMEELGTEVFRGDLTEAESLEGCCDEMDAVIHSACALASTFDAGRAALDLFMAVNRDGTVNLAREALKQKGLRFVHVSSTAAMGPPTTIEVDESSPCQPRTPYEISKREAELSLLEMFREDGLNVVILRPCHMAGEGKADREMIKLFKLVRRGRPLNRRQTNTRKNPDFGRAHDGTRLSYPQSGSTRLESPNHQRGMVQRRQSALALQSNARYTDTV